MYVELNQTALSVSQICQEETVVKMIPVNALLLLSVFFPRILCDQLKPIKNKSDSKLYSFQKREVGILVLGSFNSNSLFRFT